MSLSPNYNNNSGTCRIDLVNDLILTMKSDRLFVGLLADAKHLEEKGQDERSANASMFAVQDDEEETLLCSWAPQDGQWLHDDPEADERVCRSTN